MPWKEVSAVDLREEFVLLAEAEGSNLRALCRCFGVSPAAFRPASGGCSDERRAGDFL